MYRKSATFRSTHPLSLVILSEAKNHLPQHTADEWLLRFPQHMTSPWVRVTPVPQLFLYMSLTHFPYALATTTTQYQEVPQPDGAFLSPP